MTQRVYDCIIIGAGPGGLQAAIYLGRYNRAVLLLDRSGGRTWHAKHIENVLTHKHIAGSEIIERGIEQAKRFNVQVERKRVTSVRKEAVFIVQADDALYRAHTVIVSSGVYDILPPIKNIYTYLGAGYYTCVDCDGYHLTGRKVAILGDKLQTVNIALAIKQMFTTDITYIPYRFRLPESAVEVLKDEGMVLMDREPVKLFGGEKFEGIELEDGEQLKFDAIMASFGTRLNDEFLKGLDLKRDAAGFKFVVNSVYESSLRGLYIVGPLNTGQDQVIIAAGEGAVAAIEVNKTLLEMKETESGEKAEVCRL